jgi:DNA-binding FadR family transcriptional regulator
MDRVYRRIMSELLDDIVTGEIPAGEWLPTVSDVAVRHACSPGAAREAIRALEERRVIEVHAGAGQQVVGSDRWAVLDRDVAEAALLRHPDHQLLGEAVDYFRHCEIQVSKLAARRVRDGDLRLLTETLDEMRAASRGGNGAGVGDAHFEEAEAFFHRAFTLIARNRFIASSLEGLHPVLARARRERAADRDPVVVRLHERIVAALEARDPVAAAAAADDYGRHLAGWLRA